MEKESDGQHRPTYLLRVSSSGGDGETARAVINGKDGWISKGWSCGAWFCAELQ